MRIGKIFVLFYCSFFSLQASYENLPEKFVQIMQQPKYNHATWGIYVKDPVTNFTYFDLNSDKFFLPASTTKLFTVAALFNAYGDDYRFKTPLFALGTITNGQLNGDLLLVGQGDLTFGGRQTDADTIEYTKMDHIYANIAPDTILTKEDPLTAIKSLSRQVKEKGILKINGDVLIDDSLFETVTKRGNTLSPIMINENLIDFLINPTQIGEIAKLVVRPNVSGYHIKNELKTVERGTTLKIEISSDDLGQNISLKGMIPIDSKDLVRTFSIKDPKHFAKNALMDALKSDGITVNTTGKTSKIPQIMDYQGVDPIAVWTSPPLSEYGKLILKVSHNVGADLVPLLLSVKAGKLSFDDGMLLFGNFVMDEVKIPSNSFVFLDAAGGDGNRLTPKAEVALLEYMKNQPHEKFQKYYDALPILGGDGSLEDFGKNTNTVNKVRTKPGTGISFNAATGDFFLTTQALTGYVEGKNGHLILFMISVNNAELKKIEDVPAIFEEFAEMMGVIYDLSDLQKG